MTARIINGVTITWDADDPIIAKHSTGEDEDATGYGHVNLGEHTLWPCILGTDTDVVTACDNLIAAVQEVRSHALVRAAKEA